MTEASTLSTTNSLTGDGTDWVAIRDLTARYNRAADDGDVADFVGVFTDDGILEVQSTGGEPRLYSGREQLAAVPELSGGQQVHFKTDPVIELHGDRATQVCTLILCRRLDGRLSGFTTGRYTDELVRSDDGWRFVRRTVLVDGAGEGKFPARTEEGR
jgi:hypothetical protein